MRIRSIGLIGLAFLALTGCGHMPVTSMVRLAQVDFQTTDPEMLRVAVQLPRLLRARAESTMLRITVGLADGSSQARNFALRTAHEGDAPAADREAAVSTFALTARDVAELRAFRTALIRQQKGRSGGSLAVTVQPDVCRTAPLPDGPVRFTTYLKTGETGGYVVLARDVDLTTVAPGHDVVAKIPACN
jgi:hypothetical protein